MAIKILYSKYYLHNTAPETFRKAMRN